MTTFVVAEVATTWLNPDWHDFPGLAERCAACGVQAVKVQWVSDPHAMAARRKMPEFTYDYLNWPIAWMPEMAKAREQAGVEFMCTAYLPCDVTAIDPHVKRHKIASLELHDQELLRACRETRKPIIVSTGCSSASEINWLRLIGCDVVHCVAGYPSPREQLNLAAIRTIDYRFRGFSDHSANVLTGMLAVACGARYLEVHVRHDLTPKDNPDYGHSLMIEQLREYVANVRWAEAALGDGIKRIQPCEEALRKHRVMT